MRSEAPGPPNEELLKAALLGIGLILFLTVIGVLFTGSYLSTGVWPGVADVLTAIIAGRSERFVFSPWHAVLGALVLGVVLTGGITYGRRRAARIAREVPVDKKAKHMGRGAAFNRAAVEARNAREGLLGDDVPEGIAPGLYYGTSIDDGEDLYADYRGTMSVYMGPGGGKTTGTAVPFVLDAPGNVLATGVRREIADDTRWAAEQRGTFWCFDPQRIADYHAGHEPAWWWNPLRDVGDDPTRAKSLADILVEAYMPPGANKHPFFDTKGPALLAYLILAASIDGAQLPQVYEWLNSPKDQRPIRVLYGAGHSLPGKFVQSVYSMHPETRDSLMSTAGNAIEFLVDPGIRMWITDTAGRPEFRPEEFVKPHRGDTVARDTFIALSRDGDGSAASLTTALMVSITRAAVAESQHHKKGRLPIPLVCVLDEVANTTPWKKLPKQFSYFGGSGITLVAFFQNWAQGVEAWTEPGMDQLWGASTVRLVGGGIADTKHLGHVRDLIGKRHVKKRTSQTGGTRAGGMTYAFTEEPILDIDELAALSGGRFVLIPSQGYALLGKLRPWFDRPEMRDVVQTSQAKYGPGL